MFERSSNKWSNYLFVYGKHTALRRSKQCWQECTLVLKGPIYFDILAQVRSSVPLKQVVVTAYRALVCISKGLSRAQTSSFRWM